MGKLAPVPPSAAECIEAAHVFTVEMLLPSQLGTRNRLDTGARRLLLAVLELAALDLAGKGTYQGATRGVRSEDQRARHRATAIAWVESGKWASTACAFPSGGSVPL